VNYQPGALRQLESGTEQLESIDALEFIDGVVGPNRVRQHSINMVQERQDFQTIAVKNGLPIRAPTALAVPLPTSIAAKCHWASVLKVARRFSIRVRPPPRVPELVRFAFFQLA
jgi:hypothetical protein